MKFRSNRQGVLWMDGQTLRPALFVPLSEVSA